MVSRNTLIILASTSPQRKNLLELLQIPFQIIAPRCEEIIDPDWTPAQAVQKLAQQKAYSVLSLLTEGIVIGSDTLLEFEGRPLGKPKDIHHALEMLIALQGNIHRILTAVYCLDIQSQQSLLHLETIEVCMKPWSAAELSNYLKRENTLDKAGAYAIQGQGVQLMDWIRGDYFAAVGLPIKPIAHFLNELSIHLPVSIETLYSNSIFTQQHRMI